MSDNADLVTVVIPTFNRSTYLKTSLRSVLAQSYSPLEIIVSDNASNDDTSQVVAQFRDQRLCYRKRPSTIPATEHFNVCSIEAKGRYLVFVADDDEIGTGFIEAMVSAFRACPRATVGLSGFELMDEQDATLRSLPAPDWTCCDGLEFMLDWAWGRMTMPVAMLASIFVETKMFRSAGGFPYFVNGINSDNAAALSLALQGDVVYAGTAVYRYRIHTGNTSFGAPYCQLAEGAAQFRDFAQSGSPLAELILGLPQHQQALLKRGLSYHLAHEYLERLRTSSNLKSRWEYLKAIFYYRIDLEYLKALVHPAW